MAIERHVLRPSEALISVHDVTEQPRNLIVVFIFILKCRCPCKFSRDVQERWRAALLIHPAGRAVVCALPAWKTEMSLRRYGNVSSALCRIVQSSRTYTTQSLIILLPESACKHFLQLANTHFSFTTIINKFLTVIGFYRFYRSVCLSRPFSRNAEKNRSQGLGTRVG